MANSQTFTLELNMDERTTEHHIDVLEYMIKNRLCAKPLTYGDAHKQVNELIEIFGTNVLDIIHVTNRRFG